MSRFRVEKAAIGIWPRIGPKNVFFALMPPGRSVRHPLKRLARMLESVTSLEASGKQESQARRSRTIPLGTYRRAQSGFAPAESHLSSGDAAHMN